MAEAETNKTKKVWSKAFRSQTLRARLRSPLKKFPGGIAGKAQTGTTEDASMALKESIISVPIDQKELRLLTDQLEKIVNVSSVSNAPDGVNKVQDWVEARLKSMDFKIERREDPTGRFADLIIATRRGSDPRFITMISHADTVLSTHDTGKFKILEDGRTAMGSGVIDNKGGLVVALRGLEKYLAANSTPKFSLRFVCSPNEEVGSIGNTDTFRVFARDSVMALGFEPALGHGDVIHSRRGNRWYNLKIVGTEGHAGRSKGEHVNAAHELAKKITKLAKLTDYKKNVSVQVGAITAGRDKYNVICGQAEAKIDVRFATFRAREKLHKKITKIFAKKYFFSLDGSQSAVSSFELADDCPPFATTLLSSGYVRSLVKIIENIEKREVQSLCAGGAGDVNYMSEKSVIVMDGLGPIGRNMHSINESVDLHSLVTRSEAFSQYLDLMNKKLR